MTVESSANQKPPTSQTILFIEDETVILDTMGEILEDLGYQVLKANDGLKACDVFQQNAAVVNLAIVDYSLPKRTGIEVVKFMKSISSNLKVILCSGCAQSDIRHQFDEFGDIVFLAKPYEITQMSQLIEKCLSD